MNHPATPTAPDALDEQPNFAPKLYGIAALVATIVIGGMWLVARFSDMDYNRDLQGWREKLNLIAESRTAEVDAWVSGNFKELRTLADNPSLQLYVTELKLISEGSRKPRVEGESGEPSQKSYLRNLLLYTAQRSGFGNAAGSIPANVQKGGKSGLAIIDNNGNVLVASAMPQQTKDLMLEHMKQSTPGQEGLIDIRKDKDGTAYMGFVVPVFAIQGDRNAESQLARVVGIKLLDDAGLFTLLKHPGTTEKTLETLIMRQMEDKVEYLSPRMDGAALLSGPDSQQSGLASLLRSVGEFTASITDYRGQKVLATSRAVSGTPWTLVIKIDQQEALAESAQRRAGLEIFLFMMIAIIALVVAATWWRANSKRSVLMSSYFQRMATRAQAQEQLLRLVADHQPEPIYIVDNEQVVRFANLQAAQEAGMSVEAIPGRTLRDLRGPIRAEHLAEKCEEVLKRGQVAYAVEREGEDRDTQMVFRSAYVPLDHIPLVNLPRPTPGVLVVEQDITEVVRERELRMKTQRQLTETLVTLVDKRDPFSANHSKLVSQLAYEVAVQMELDSASIETASKAGMLMNIGKIIVPPELLTKTTPLSFEEKRTIHQSMNMAAELMEGISFDGPVAETLRQWQEKWDGTGPQGLRGEDILITARIIACANAFIGMVSPRSWRTAMPIENAGRFLMEQCDSHFDRRVVVALLNFIDNHDGKAWLTRVLSEGRDEEAA
ncbi:MAG: PAS domain S-box protein [Proteobacteria bacterium]|nr:PAS domain S-box protein [Pseudomonadota bacterium]